MFSNFSREEIFFTLTCLHHPSQKNPPKLLSESRRMNSNCLFHTHLCLDFLHLSIPVNLGSGLSPRGIVKCCCHTYPNDRLLHLSLPVNRGSGLSSRGIVKCCHTSPNERLLHLSLPAKRGSGLSPRGIVLCVAIPIQTKGFYI